MESANSLGFTEPYQYPPTQMSGLDDVTVSAVAPPDVLWDEFTQSLNSFYSRPHHRDDSSHSLEDGSRLRLEHGFSLWLEDLHNWFGGSEEKVLVNL